LKPGCSRLPAGVAPDENQGSDDSGSALAVSLLSYPELDHIVDAWPALPEALRAGILAMIAATRKDG
jgi:hypothetical protein